jgi:hypothetical protein
MKKITEGKVLILGDIHQNLAYSNAILKKEDKFDHCVFLGDWFDTFRQIDNTIAYSMKETCKWINSKLDDDRFTWLLGNHDLSYVSSYKQNDFQPRGTHYCCSGWTKSKAKDFNRTIEPEWIKKLELCCKVGDAYCVHGGFSYDQFKPFMSEEDNIINLYNDWEETKSTFMHDNRHWIGYVGPSRHGMDRYSSPVWLDFFDEFRPLDNVRIICGHTNSRFNPYCKENSAGMENWCIDNEQKMYIVYQDGKFEIKPITEKDYSEFLTFDM